jgi:hypothetical protein
MPATLDRLKAQWGNQFQALSQDDRLFLLSCIAEHLRTGKSSCTADILDALDPSADVSADICDAFRDLAQESDKTLIGVIVALSNQLYFHAHQLRQPKVSGNLAKEPDVAAILQPSK